MTTFKLLLLLFIIVTTYTFNSSDAKNVTKRHLISKFFANNPFALNFFNGRHENYQQIHRQHDNSYNKYHHYEWNNGVENNDEIIVVPVEPDIAVKNINDLTLIDNVDTYFDKLPHFDRKINFNNAPIIHHRDFITPQIDFITAPQVIVDDLKTPQIDTYFDKLPFYDRTINFRDSTPIINNVADFLVPFHDKTSSANRFFVIDNDYERFGDAESSDQNIVTVHPANNNNNNNNNQQRVDYGFKILPNYHRFIDFQIPASDISPGLSRNFEIPAQIGNLQRFKTPATNLATIIDLPATNTLSKFQVAPVVLNRNFKIPSENRNVENFQTLNNFHSVTSSDNNIQFQVPSQVRNVQNFRNLASQSFVVAIPNSKPNLNRNFQVPAEIRNVQHFQASLSNQPVPILNRNFEIPAENSKSANFRITTLSEILDSTSSPHLPAINSDFETAPILNRHFQIPAQIATPTNFRINDDPVKLERIQRVPEITPVKFKSKLAPISTRILATIDDLKAQNSPVFRDLPRFNKNVNFHKAGRTSRPSRHKNNNNDNNDFNNLPKFIRSHDFNPSIITTPSAAFQIFVNTSKIDDQSAHFTTNIDNIKLTDEITDSTLNTLPISRYLQKFRNNNNNNGPRFVSRVNPSIETTPRIKKIVRIYRKKNDGEAKILDHNLQFIAPHQEKLLQRNNNNNNNERDDNEDLSGFFQAKYGRRIAN